MPSCEDSTDYEDALEEQIATETTRSDINPTTKQVSTQPQEVLHACDICGRTLKYKYLLRNHNLSHSKEKPYPCEWPNCQRSFRFNANLKRHVQEVHKQIPRCEGLANCWTVNITMVRPLVAHTSIWHVSNPNLLLRENDDVDDAQKVVRSQENSLSRLLLVLGVEKEKEDTDVKEARKEGEGAVPDPAPQENNSQQKELILTEDEPCSKSSHSSQVETTVTDTNQIQISSPVTQTHAILADPKASQQSQAQNRTQVTDTNEVKDYFSTDWEFF